MSDVTGGMYGADVDELRHLAQQLNQAATHFATITAHLTTLMAQTTWEGPDALHAQSEWENRSRPALLSATDLLTGAREALLRNADDQDGSSREEGGSIAAAVAGAAASTAGRRRSRCCCWRRARWHRAVPRQRPAKDREAT